MEELGVDVVNVRAETHMCGRFVVVCLSSMDALGNKVALFTDDLSLTGELTLCVLGIWVSSRKVLCKKREESG